jgi:hypothetical protein
MGWWAVPTLRKLCPFGVRDLNWLINLVDHRIEVFTEPTGPTAKPDYRRRQDFGPTEMIPLVIEGCEVGWLAVSGLFP